MLRGGDVAQLVRASDHHAADTGSQSPLSLQTFLSVSEHPPCANAGINICVPIKDLVAHVRVRWIMETLKHPACTVGWVG